MRFDTECRQCKQAVTLDSEKIDFYAINEAWSIDIEHDQEEIIDRGFLEFASGMIGADAQAHCPNCGGLMEIDANKEGMPVEAWPPCLRQEITREQQQEFNARAKARRKRGQV